VLIADPLGRNRVQGRLIGALAIRASIFSRHLQGSAMVVNDSYGPESESDNLLLHCPAWQRHGHCHYYPQHKCLCLTMLLASTRVTAEFDQIVLFLTIPIDIGTMCDAKLEFLLSHRRQLAVRSVSKQPNQFVNWIIVV
jgi:hypothetical protein